jgi:thiol-disulfide isomerase/thioredoxin
MKLLSKMTLQKSAVVGLLLCHCIVNAQTNPTPIITNISTANIKTDTIKNVAPRAIEQWETTNKPGTAFKNFICLSLNKKVFNTADIPANKNIILMMFNPTCEHCVEQTKLFIEREKEFPNTFFLFMTGDQMEDYAADYLKQSGFENKENWILGFDINKATNGLFAYKALPQIMIYSQDKILLDVFYKDTPINKILAALDKDPKQAALNPDKYLKETPPQINYNGKKVKKLWLLKK